MYHDYNTTDLSKSYTTIKLFSHQPGRDMGTSYSTAQQIEDGVAVDLGTSYGSLQYVGDLTEQQKLNVYHTMCKFSDVTSRQQATSYSAMARFDTLDTRESSVVYRSLSNVSEPIKLEMLSTYPSMRHVKLFENRDLIQAYTSVDELKQYKHAQQLSVYNTTSDVKQIPQPSKLSIYNTLRAFENMQSLDRNVEYNTLGKIKQSKSDKLLTYRSIKDFKTKEDPDLPVNYNTIKDFRSKVNLDRPVSYTTAQKVLADPHAFVFCDNQTYTFGASTVAVDTTLNNYYLPRNTYGLNKVRLIFLPNELELLTPPNTIGYPDCDCSYPYNVRVSDVKLILDDETEYDLNTPGVMINNTSTHCPVSSHHVGQLFDGELMTTFEQLTSFTGSFWTEGHMIVEIHLPETVPIRWVDVAPGGYDDMPRNWPGHVRIDGHYPGVDDWFCMYARAHYRTYIPGHTYHNTRPDVWKVGSYMRFSTVRNNELHEYNHRWKREILTSCA